MCILKLARKLTTSFCAFLQRHSQTLLPLDVECIAATCNATFFLTPDILLWHVCEPINSSECQKQYVLSSETIFKTYGRNCATNAMPKQKDLNLTTHTCMCTHKKAVSWPIAMYCNRTFYTECIMCFECI